MLLAVLQCQSSIYSIYLVLNHFLGKLIFTDLIPFLPLCGCAEAVFSKDK